MAKWQHWLWGIGLGDMKDVKFGMSWGDTLYFPDSDWKKAICGSISVKARDPQWPLCEVVKEPRFQWRTKNVVDATAIGYITKFSLVKSFMNYKKKLNGNNYTSWSILWFIDLHFLLPINKIWKLFLLLLSWFHIIYIAFYVYVCIVVISIIILYNKIQKISK